MSHISSLRCLSTNKTLFSSSLTAEHCPRAQLKEWSLANACQNGSKSFYKRRISGAHCLNNASLVRTESCLCSLNDFECAPGYRRSKEGFCLARSHYFNVDDCGCHENRTVSTKRRGYVKTTENQCLDGVETFLSDAFVQRRDSNQPNLFFYGNDERNKRPIIEIHTNGFDHQETDENDDEDDEVEELIKNTIWSIDPTYEITAITFDETNKQVYMAVEQDQSSVVYRISVRRENVRKSIENFRIRFVCFFDFQKDLREQTRSSKQLSFDTNNQIYKSVDQRIESLTVDWLTKNLYLLVRNKKTQQQNVVLIDLRTQKRRTLLKNQQIQPAVLIVDPLKNDLYWISRQSPYQFNIANLQGQIEKQIVLSTGESNISFVSYDPISQEILYVIDSKIYGLNTLDHRQLKGRLIYEHSSIIKNPIFIHPNLYFTNDLNETDSTPISLNAIDIVAKSFAKNLVRLKDFSSLKLSLNMVPTMPTSTKTFFSMKNSSFGRFCFHFKAQLLIRVRIIRVQIFVYLLNMDNFDVFAVTMQSKENFSVVNSRNEHFRLVIKRVHVQQQNDSLLAHVKRVREEKCVCFC